MSSIRLGTASPATQATTAETLQLVDRLATRAASNHIDILLLPEAFLGGYPRGSDFGSVVGSRSAQGREAYAKYFQAAVNLGDVVGDGGAGAGDRWVKRQLQVPEGEEYRGDGTREKLERIACETGVFLVTGLVERTGGSLYCAVVYVCPHKGVIGKRRKVMPTGTERLIWAQASPSTLRAVSTVIRGTRINLAAAICWESYMPLLRQSLYNQNINLYLAPTADARDAWLSLMRSIGVEGRCFVVSSNMAVRGGQDSHASTNGRPASAVRDGGRRFSCSADEPGMDIALPKSGSPSRSRRRRKSIFDPDGNEIVLSCPVDENGVATTTTAAPTKVDDTAVTDKPTWSCRGGSCIVDPFGEVLAGPQWEDDEGMIYADVDFQKCIQGRLDLDAGGSYSRNDVFKLTVEGLDMEPLPY
ncbi:carbon-nitrogen hydrolase [Emericellopsis atlantica]|uniref:Carbon-nitrogen hydrolase n=1 Tax=Emericellopsis atlantica TaxID=2614577 RepID=A0A9P8CSX8_9HYPO|nr:carbon-nitrogen hydrolase [Emericellopsis atlantica]KAG9256231.1 carbon-nitrogen hydrolase [Emericellopsis atlantica]